MRRVFFLALAFLVICLPLSANAASVRGYTTKKGTYVQPHQRTSPNKTKTDNWSSKGNTNPYTGKKGTKDPYK